MKVGTTSTCGQRCSAFGSLMIPLLVSKVKPCGQTTLPRHSFSGAEQRYTPGNVYCGFVEMCLEPCLKIGLPVRQIAEKSFRVVNLHQLFGQRVVPHTLAQDRRAEYCPAIPQQRLHVLKYDALARQITREAVQEIVERDGAKSRHADIDALKNVAHIAGRIVATQALG